MRSSKIAPTVVESTVLPRMVRLEDNLYGAAFFLMKLAPARFILDRARDEGLLSEGQVVIETTSGTFGLALAMLCNLRRYRLILVSDPAVDPAFCRRLEDLGARVEICAKPAPIGGYQRARLDRMAELQGEYPDHFCPSQYSNPHNPGAYAPFAELLAETIGRVDYLVGTVGSGGSMCGTTSYLRLLLPDLKAIGVDSRGSVLFGQPDEKRLLRGLGNSLMPPNLDHTIFDDVHWVTAAEGFAATRALHRRHSLFVGPTSGAAYMVARWLAERHPRANVVTIFPDEGHRYQDTVYNDQWLLANDVYLSHPPTAPRLIENPLEADKSWCYMNWNRQTYEEVMGAAFVETR